MKKFLAGLLACTLLLGTVPAYAQTGVQTDVNIEGTAELSKDIEDKVMLEYFMAPPIQTFAAFDQYFGEKEPNDYMEDAESLEHDNTFRGSYAPGDVDLYSIYVPERHQVNLLVAADTEGLLCRLLSSNGQTAIVDAKRVEVEETQSGKIYYNLTYELPHGHYYIALTDLTIAEGDYEYELYYWTERTSVDPSPFLDVTYDNKKPYYYDPVMWAYENGIVAGTTATLFSPEKGCTRGQAMTFLWRAAGEPEPSNNNHPFTDLVEGKFYMTPVIWAVEEGITTGKTETTFAPELICTRGQIVTFLWKSCGMPEPELEENPFEDVKAGAYYEDAVLWAMEKGITAGRTETTFEPNEPCTRAQIVTFFYRLNQSVSETVM